MYLLELGKAQRLEILGVDVLGCCEGCGTEDRKIFVLTSGEYFCGECLWDRVAELSLEDISPAGRAGFHVIHGDPDTFFQAHDTPFPTVYDVEGNEVGGGRDLAE